MTWIDHLYAFIGFLAWIVITIFIVLGLVGIFFFGALLPLMLPLIMVWFTCYCIWIWIKGLFEPRRR